MARSVREGSFEYWNVDATVEGLRQELNQMMERWKDKRPKHVKYTIILED